MSGARLKATPRDTVKSLKNLFRTLLSAPTIKYPLFSVETQDMPSQSNSKEENWLYTAGILVKLFKNLVLKRIMEIR